MRYSIHYQSVFRVCVLLILQGTIGLQNLGAMQDLSAPANDISPLLAEANIDIDENHITLGNWLNVVSDPSLDGNWNCNFARDEPSFRRRGVNLDLIVLERFRCRGVSRRSALRLLLANHDLGFCEGNKHILVTDFLISCHLRSGAHQMPREEELQSREVKIRRAATYHLGYFNLDSELWSSPLGLLLLDSDLEVRFNSIFAISRLDKIPRNLLTKLLDAIKSDDPTTAHAAVFSLSRAGIDACPYLDELLLSGKVEAVRMASFAYRLMGTKLVAHRDRLFELGLGISRRSDLEEGNRCFEILHAVASAVASVDPAIDIEEFKQVLSSEYPSEKVFIIEIARECGSNSLAIQPALDSFLSDDSRFVRRAAARCLAQLATFGTINRESLVKATTDSDHQTALWATKALRSIEQRER